MDRGGSGEIVEVEDKGELSDGEKGESSMNGEREVIRWRDGQVFTDWGERTGVCSDDRFNEF